MFNKYNASNLETKLGLQKGGHGRQLHCAGMDNLITFGHCRYFSQN